jgi:hypothetical protein
MARFMIGKRFMAMSDGRAMKYLKDYMMPEEMEDDEDEMEDDDQEEIYYKDPKTGELVKLKTGDTTIKKSSATWKRSIGDTAEQMKKAEQLGLKSASDELKRRMEEKKKKLSGKE